MGAKKELWTDCKICGGSGYIRGEDVPMTDPSFGKLVLCECRKEEAKKSEVEKHQKMSNLTEKEKQIDFADVMDFGGNSRDMIDVMADFIEDPTGLITIWGGSGNAKSTISIGTVNHLLDQGIPAIYTTIFDLMSNIRKAFGNQDLDSIDILEVYQEARVLIIDEFDKIKKTDWVEEQVTSLIDRRYRTGESGESGTVILMNSDPQTLDPWIESRLSSGRIIHNTQADQRGIVTQYNVGDGG